MNWRALFNSISKQNKEGSDGITKKEWNFIVNSLAQQSNNNTLGIDEIKRILAKDFDVEKVSKVVEFLTLQSEAHSKDLTNLERFVISENEPSGSERISFWIEIKGD